LLFIFFGYCGCVRLTLLSTLIAENAPAEIKGTVTITIALIYCNYFGIQLISALNTFYQLNAIYLCLALGPLGIG
jgi:hypothetical protein